MKIVAIPYKDTEIGLKIPENIELNISTPKTNKNHINWRNKLDKILLSDKLTDFLDNLKNRTLLIIINDSSRATPTSTLLDVIIPLFDDIKTNILFIVATGSHHKSTHDELQDLFQHHFQRFKDRIIIHNAYDPNQLIYLGKTTFKTPVWVNKIIKDQRIDGILCINSIEPHYFAGWTGGRKSIMPGIAGIKTITATHKHALKSSSKVCKLKGNPVHDDLQECFDIVEKDFGKLITSFQFIIDGNNSIHHIIYGHPILALEEGVNFATQIFQVPIPHLYDLVICVVLPPLDQTLYQAHKGLEHGFNALNIEHGKFLNKKQDILLWASCQGGIGPANFLEPIKELDNIATPEIIKKLEKNYKLGYHKSAKIADKAAKANLWLYSDLSVTLARSALFNPISNPQIWINNLIKEKKINSILILLDAGVTVPIIN